MMPAWNPLPPHAPGTQPPPGPPPGYPFNMPPAYTPVQVRQSFAPTYPPPPPTMAAPQYPVHPGYVQFPPAPLPTNHNPPANYTAPSPEAANKKVDWPDAVRYYVQRSFLPEHNDPSISPDDMKEKLKETIQQAKNNGVMYSIDWDSMPLPQQMIKSERAHALRSPAVRSGEDQRADNWTSSTTMTSKKRKSDEFEKDGKEEATAASWHKTSSLESRISHSSPEKRPAVDEAATKSKLQKQMEKRQRRFDGGYKSSYHATSPSPEPSKPGPVVGTCETLEKRYLRLTSAPNPAVVRPERVLRQTLELLKKKWRKEGNYSYTCDQFKSMRQDLTVQRIKNDFTVSVYEIHARIALEKGDLGEYNQCQTQLRALYQLGLKGNPLEFKAYRILYFIHTANRSALNDAIKDLTTAEKEARSIKHALGVRSSLALGNYHRFFQLYLDTPNMGAYLMDMFVGRERLAALSNICKAYKPDVRLRFITEELGFESDVDAAQFIIDQNGQHLLEERDDFIAFLSGKAGSLFEDSRRTAFSRVDIKGQI